MTIKENVTQSNTQSQKETQGTPNVRKKISCFTLMMMTAALFMTLRNMPSMAETGLQMIFFNIITVFAFLLPIALVAAELATGWPEDGVFLWIKIAFGTKAGFVAVWLQWLQSVFGITSIMAYTAGTFAYIINPSLGDNHIFIGLSIIIIYWLATFLNSFGTRMSGKISTIALSLGVLFPTALLIIGGIIYAIKGNPIHLNLALTYDNIFPSFASKESWILFLSFIFGFVGIEVSASHANDVNNPQKNYPIAIFSAAIIGFFATLFGALAISFIIPIKEIDPVNGAIQAFSILLKDYNLSFVIPIIAFLIALGAAGQVSTWVVGPIKGIFSVAKRGVIPPALAKTNKHDVPMRLLVIQALCMTSVGVVFLFVKDVRMLFTVLTSIAIVLYCVMYMLLFASGIKLRYTHPNVDRAYRVPGKTNFGMWAVCLVGGICALMCFVIGFIPPDDLPFSNMTYFVTLIIGLIIAILLPIIFHQLTVLNFKRKALKSKK